MKLSADVRSNFNNRKLYGTKGEEVIFISDHEKVVIVENKEGNRFSVLKILLTEEDVQPSAVEVLTEIKTKLITKPGAKPKKVTASQNTLF